MGINVNNLIKKSADLNKKQKVIPKLGKPYLFYNKQNFELVVPMIYISSGFLGLDIRKIKAKDRHFILLNIDKLKFSKNQLRKYQYNKSMNFFEIDKNDWYSLNEMPYKKEQ